MKQIDMKSALLGLADGVLVTLTLGAAIKGPAQVERFKMATMQNHAFVIDTTSGQVWRGYYHAGSGGNTDPEFLKPKLAE